jgi:hypothetical protein
VRNLYNNVLVVIVSGNRLNRPTENFNINGNTVIISNNSAVYVSRYPIIDVPDDFIEYYRENWSLSDFGMKTPLVRSYAIKYAREKGYKYIVQLDDNITGFSLRYFNSKKGLVHTQIYNITPILNALVDILRYTNVGMSGLDMQAISIPTDKLVAERYLYSILCMDLEKVSYFFGDVEEDIAMRYQLAQKNIPTAVLVPFKYSKTGQLSSGDKSGNRGMYDELQTNRGLIMSKIYGDKYKRGTSNIIRNIAGLSRVRDNEIFRHKLKKFKVGIKVKNEIALNESLRTSFYEIIEGK